MRFEKKRIYSKAFEESHFEYCSLTWMYYSRKTNSKINLIYGRSLRIVHKGNITTSKELPKNDKSFCIQHRNIQSLAIELLNVENNLSNKIMCDIFETRNLNHNLRSQTDFMRARVNNFSFKLSSLKYSATKRWDIAPCDIRSIEKLNYFKKKKEIGKLKNAIARYANNMYFNKTLFNIY